MLDSAPTAAAVNAPPRPTSQSTARPPADLFAAAPDPEGYWKLHHNDLAAVLARYDLSWAAARVYLAMGDLTLGYGRSRDVVSIGQIAERAGMFAARHADGRRPLDYTHVGRALRVLKEKGLVGDDNPQGRTRNVTRWVTWPPPPLADQESMAQVGQISEDSRSAMATIGQSATMASPMASPMAQVGQHQSTNLPRDKGKSAAGKPPTDSRVPVFIDWFVSEFRRTKKQAYIVQGGKDGNLVKRLLKTLDAEDQGGLAKLQAAARKMLADGWADGKADIGLLSAKINNWLASGTPARGRAIDYSKGF